MIFCRSKRMHLFRLIQEAVHQVGADRAAQALGCARSTLYNKINPDDDPAGNRPHKLALVEWVKLLKLTHDLRSLHKINALCSLVAVPFEKHRPDDLCWLTMQARHAAGHGKAGLKLLEAVGERLDDTARLTLRACFYQAAQEAMNIYHALEYQGEGEGLPKAA